MGQEGTQGTKTHEDVPKGPGTDWERLRGIHRGIRKRTTNPRCKDYAAYRGRGITMCEEWMDFDNFYDWAMSHGYRKDLTIDRVNNNKGYDPYNCRWVSRKGQANNRTTAKRYTIDGHTKTLVQWSREYGIPPDVILHRLERGWDLEKAIKEPRKPKSK